MKKILITIAAVLTTLAAGAQTLKITTSSGTTPISASDMTESNPGVFSNGTTLTINGTTFNLSDITSAEVTSESSSSDVEANHVNIVYSGSSATVTMADNVKDYVTASVNGGHVTITQSNTAAIDDDEITYVLSGTSTDGSLTLGGSYKCTVSLAGVTLTNPSGAAIYITNSKRIKLSAKKNTTNTITDGSGSQKACIYSKGQLQIQGNGELNVVGNYKHGIKSASYIEIKNLTLNITSTVGDGINCEEYFLMKSGTVTLSGIGDDGIQCDYGDSTALTGETTDHEDEDTGNIYIDGGTLTVTADATAAKCVKGEGSIRVSGGTVNLYANGAIDLSDSTDPSYTAGFKADGNFEQTGGDITISVTGGAGRGIACTGTFTSAESSTGALTITNSGETSSASSYFCTAKSIKAGAVVINGGTIDITTTGAASKGIKGDSDDGTGNITITGGTVTVKAQGTGAIDYTESDGKGCSGLNADNNITISGGTITLTATNKGGKGMKCDGVLTVSGGTINATSSGSNYSSGSYSASAKAIKAGVKSSSSSRASTSYYGGIVITGGTIVAKASSHEAIESKNTIDISGGDVYAQSSDDAINSASTFNISGGYVMGYSTGNDGLDANGNFNISGGVVYAIGTSSPEVAIDANTEGGYKLTISGGIIFSCGPLESGSTFTQSCYSASSISKNVWYSLTNGSNTYCFKTPSSLNVSTLVVSASSQPTVMSGVTVSSGTSILSGMGYYGASVSGGSSVSLSSYTGGNSGGGGQPGGGGGPGGGGPGGGR